MVSPTNWHPWNTHWRTDVKKHRSLTNTHWVHFFDDWLVVTGTCFMTFHSVGNGMSSSQLTFTPSFFRGVGQPPTRMTMVFVRDISIVNRLIYIYITYKRGRYTTNQAILAMENHHFWWENPLFQLGHHFDHDSSPGRLVHPGAEPPLRHLDVQLLPLGMDGRTSFETEKKPWG